jgi:hypothetical protein
MKATREQVLAMAKEALVEISELIAMPSALDTINKALGEQETKDESN